MGKTVKQIADELNVDRQKVYRFIKKNCIKELYHEQGANRYDDTVANRLKMELLGEKAVSKAVSPNSCEQYHEQGANRYNDTVVEVLKKQLEVMQKNIDVLNDELKDKNEQIRGLTKALDQQQHLHRVDQQKVLALETKTEEKPIEVRPSETTPTKKTVKERPKQPQKRSIFTSLKKGW